MKARIAKKILKNLHVMRLNQGDVLLVKVPTTVYSPQLADRMASNLKGIFPDNRVLVAPADMKMEVVRKWVAHELVEDAKTSAQGAVE